MRVYYLTASEAPNRHRILAAVWERDYVAFDASVLAPHQIIVVDEADVNLPELRALAKTLALTPRPGQPPPPRWRAAPPNQLERPDGSLWPPVANPERTALFQPLPGPIGMIAFLDAIIGDALTTPREKQLARLVRRLVRRLRQREHGAADD